VDYWFILHSIIKGVNWPVQYINSPNTIPPMLRPSCLDRASAKRCVHFMQSIALYVWLNTSSPCSESVLLYYHQPIHTHRNLVIISAHIQSLVWAHMYSLQFLLQLAEIRCSMLRHLYMSGLYSVIGRL